MNDDKTMKYVLGVVFAATLSSGILIGVLLGTLVSPSSILNTVARTPVMWLIALGTLAAAVSLGTWLYHWIWGDLVRRAMELGP